MCTGMRVPCAARLKIDRQAEQSFVLTENIRARINSVRGDEGFS